MKDRILSIDDNPIVSATIAARLWAVGHTVRCAKDQVEASLALQAQTFDLILMDVQMAEVNGFTLAAQLGGRGLAAANSIVFLSAGDQIEDIRRAKSLGARGYLSKGYAATALADAIHRLLADADIVWMDDYHTLRRTIPNHGSAKRPHLQLVSVASPRPIRGFHSAPKSPSTSPIG